MPDRPSRDRALMQTAYIWAERSTCSRLHVGCVIHRDGRILVQGYNGAPAGLKHCDHMCDCGLPIDQALKGAGHKDWCKAAPGCTRAVHAEQNAISFAARWGVELKYASVSVTHQPCMSCAQSIINAGIVEVTYVEPYRLQDGIDLLTEAGIIVSRMLMSPNHQ